MKEHPLINHLTRQIPPIAHTPMYNWHKFWSRKTWNVVAEHIKTYCPENGIVFDPFAGSGVTALEALKIGRKAIVCDILPIATEIIRLSIKPVSLNELHDAFIRIEKQVKERILSLYETKCRKCGYIFPFATAIWTQKREKNTEPIMDKCIAIRYQYCPRCRDSRRSYDPPIKFDEDVLMKIEKKEITEWYPKQKLYHINGKPFMKKEKFESINELFTKRNLQALAWLMEAIEKETNKDLKDLLKVSFTSMVHLCSRLLAEGRLGYRPFSGVGWNQQSYWFMPQFMESNVWYKFESAIHGAQGIMKAKKETNQYYNNVKIAKSYKGVIEGKHDAYIHTGSSLDLMEKIHKDYGGTSIMDYIFTDPPYDASIQFGELAYLWIVWLKKEHKYLETISTDEVIRSDRQNKSFDVYYSFLSRSFEDMFKILKPKCYLSVTFHNPTFKVRNATIHAGVYAGFEFQKIHHQELARPSAKSLLQPFGSAQGDFYLRFFKPKTKKEALKPIEIDEIRFEKIVIEKTIEVIAKRGEPTSYTMIINAIDPELAKHGYFSKLKTGLSIITVLQRHIDQEFVLVPAKLGGSEGKLWWFKDTSIVPHLEEVPLTERVEQTVLRKLQQRGKVTFTDMWNSISMEFPNSLTSDSMSIKEALRAYANPVSAGMWLIKPDSTERNIVRDHSEMINILAKIGQYLGYKIWVGRIEQTHKILNKKEIETLRKYVSFKNLAKISNIKNRKVIECMDLLWIKNNEIECVFEVEATTAMTESLNRGSNINTDVPKFLIIPERREMQLARKLKSPMFFERYQKDKWQVIFFETLAEHYSKKKGKTDIFKLINKKMKKKNDSDAEKERLLPFS